MSRHGRFAAVAALLALSALPLAAQPRRAEPDGFGGHLARIWHELTAPLLAMWGADDGAGWFDPNGKH